MCIRDSAVYKDNIEQVVNGADWIACEDPSYLADYDIDFEALIGPMMYNSIDEYSYVCQSDLVKNMCQKLEDNYGIHVLALDFNVGMRCLQTNKVIKTPADLKGIVKEEDVQFLAESAYADACRPGNPRDTSVEEIIGLYHSLM